MFRLPDFQRVVRESGFTKGEVAKVYMMSRQNVYDWLAGVSPLEGSPRERMAETVTAALLNSIRSKVLPLAASDKSVRAKRIESIRKIVQNLKPAER